MSHNQHASTSIQPNSSTTKELKTRINYLLHDSQVIREDLQSMSLSGKPSLHFKLNIIQKLSYQFIQPGEKIMRSTEVSQIDGDMQNKLRERIMEMSRLRQDLKKNCEEIHNIKFVGPDVDVCTNCGNRLE